MPGGGDARYGRFAPAGSPATASPWNAGRFEPDYDRLGRFVSVCALDKEVWESQTTGSIGAALDLWTADEFRRAGYEPDVVWPRAEQPRVVPNEVTRALSRLPAGRMRAPDGSWIDMVFVRQQVLNSAGSSSATLLGEFMPKKVDVLIAGWDRGVELMVSTKSMVDSYANNLTNRWEEFVGDLRNIRGRYPLAALGALFLADTRVLGTNQREKVYEMLEVIRIRSESGGAYDATALILAEATGPGAATLHMDLVPEHLRPGQFFETLIDGALKRVPKAERIQVRHLREAGR
jgi:hypothetical protein